MNCHQIKESYKKLIEKKDAFLSLRKDFKGNQAQAIDLKKEIERLLKDIEKTFSVKIKVENMQSPFAEVYTANGLPIPERETQIIDLEKQLEEDCQAYRDCKLESWANDIEKSKSRLKKLIRENAEHIKKELQAGAIAIFMPGRAVQGANAVETMKKKLKPECVDHGKKIIVVNSSLTTLHLNSLREIANEVTSGIPEVSYLMLVRPTQIPELTELDVVSQIEHIIEINKERIEKNQTPKHPMMPLEYSVLQKFFTTRANQNAIFQNLEPLDKLSSTSFISIISFGGVPMGTWLEGEAFLYFDQAPIDQVPGNSGVRLVMRLS